MMATGTCSGVATGGGGKGGQSGGVPFLLAEAVVVGISLTNISFELIELTILRKINFFEY